MKLIRFGEKGKEKPGLLLPDGRKIDASGFGEDYTETFFEENGLDRLKVWADKRAETAPTVDPSARLGPAVVRPSKIVCVGLNYLDHIEESGMKPPAEPVLFFKSTSSLTGPNDSLIIPRAGKKTDWEVELAVIMEKRALYISKEKTFDYIAGYSLFNDYSEREFQLEKAGQWVKGKSCDTFSPLGPFMVTKDEIDDVHNLDMWLKVNGEFEQRSNTSSMLFKVPEIVSYISNFMTLLPGDVIATGTPDGVGLGLNPPQFLKAGDRVEFGIDGLGSASQGVEDYMAN